MGFEPIDKKKREKKEKKATNKKRGGLVSDLVRDKKRKKREHVQSGHRSRGGSWDEINSPICESVIRIIQFRAIRTGDESFLLFHDRTLHSALRVRDHENNCALPAMLSPSLFVKLHDATRSMDYTFMVISLYVHYTLDFHYICIYILHATFVNFILCIYVKKRFSCRTYFCVVKCYVRVLHKLLTFCTIKMKVPN